MIKLSYADFKECTEGNLHWRTLYMYVLNTQNRMEILFYTSNFELL